MRGHQSVLYVPLFSVVAITTLLSLTLFYCDSFTIPQRVKLTSFRGGTVTVLRDKISTIGTGGIRSSTSSSTSTEKNEIQTPIEIDVDYSYVNVVDKADNRPHEQRAQLKRTARRMNHSFMHLYRHDDSLLDGQKNASSSRSLSLNCAKTYMTEYGGYDEHTLEKMAKDFPPLLDLDVIRHLRPKLRFLKYTLGAKDDEQIKAVPPQYFGSRYERVIAPRHAFLMAEGLPHGNFLLDDDAALFKEFLISCRRLKSFCALCNQWKRKYHDNYADKVYSSISDTSTGRRIDENTEITPDDIVAFDSLFVRGLLAASRGDMDPQQQHLKFYNITAGHMVYLLTAHGADTLNTDVRGISLMHWAAGSGQLDALKELICARPGGIDEVVKITAQRDGATILHWAAAGAKAKEFGCGGHINVCQYLMKNCGGPSKEKEMVNTLTKDGNSVLMWAAWSGSLDIVKLMIRHRADTSVSNRNGCTVAHWSASGGNLEICKYLYHTMDVDFNVPNNAGNTPLSHAVAYQRAEVVKWLREEICVEDINSVAQNLALDFVEWDETNNDRKKVLDLFSDWY
mmetsp:Transcript_17841/g.20612  ORF Transcript_17841/g.20612 Transcript_17841/m.20612 type:complete len:568 (-) Transcript_17841:88-1791(-)